jgi:ComF family protein
MAGSVLAPVLARAGRFARGLIEAAFPLACAACGGGLAGDGDASGWPLCAGCRGGLVDCGPPFCLACARVQASPLACARRDHRRLRAGFTWNEPLRAVVHAFKFGDVEELAGPLAAAAWVQPGFATQPRPDLVVPVPLHPLRRRERGYDQAAALARAFGARAGAPVVDVLARRRATRQQARLSAQARRVNVEGAFVLVAPALVRGRRVALVDDVVTTGATIESAAASLRSAGPRAIELWAVAHEPLE